MPDKFGFNHFGQTYGKYVVSCINCDQANGPAYYWNERMREIHFLTHTYENKLDPVLSGEVRVDNCRICGNEFKQERKRGRPRVLCYSCKPE